MLRYQEGDAQAFDALYAQFAGRVRGYLLSRLRSESLADEALQSVFLKLHRARHKYKRGSEFAPWLYTITQNTLTDRLRSERRNAAAPGHESPEPALESIASPSDAQSTQAHFERLSGHLEKLDSEQRQVLEWRYFQDLSFEVIASKLNITAASARKRVSRALGRLKGAK